MGPPLEKQANDAAVAEGRRRVEDREPPGYKDQKKEDAAGDYLVWEQVLLESERRCCDVLFVTGDVKEDWWRQERGEFRGPRLELAEEMRQRSGRRLYMLRPTSLLDYARTALGVNVRDESVQDAGRVERFLSESEEELPEGGWDAEALEDLLSRLAVEAPVQENAIRVAAGQGGFISREEVYALGNYPSDRQLKGLTRPIRRITQQLQDKDLVPEGAVDVLGTVYDEDSRGIGWAAGFRVPDEVLPLLTSKSSAWRNSG